MWDRFDQYSFIDKGIPIAPNFLIDHLTGGAYHPYMGMITPIYGSAINPEIMKNVPLWKLARNLSVSAEATLEPLLKEFGQSLILRTGYLNYNLQSLNKEIGHTAGLSLDIQINGFENNLYYLAGELQKICKKASTLSLIYDSNSWLHMNINPQKAAQFDSKIEPPLITSYDLVNNIIEKGIQPYRGII